MTKYAIVDLDGTLVDISDITHLIGQWDDFGEASCYCPPDRKMLEVVDALSDRYKILIVTGRSNKFWSKTSSWLFKQRVENAALLMRPLTNFDSDAVLKPAMVRQYIEFTCALPGPWTDHIALAIEDRDKMVEAWRNLGILTFQHCVGTY